MHKCHGWTKPFPVRHPGGKVVPVRFCVNCTARKWQKQASDNSWTPRWNSPQTNAPILPAVVRLWQDAIRQALVGNLRGCVVVCGLHGFCAVKHTHFPTPLWPQNLLLALEPNSRQDIPYRVAGHKAHQAVFYNSRCVV